MYSPDPNRRIICVFGPGDPTRESEDEYVIARVQHESREQDTLGSEGNRRFRFFGFFIARILVSTEVQAGAIPSIKADRTAEEIHDLFDAKNLVVYDRMDATMSVGRVEFGAGVIREVGVVPPSNRWETMVEIPFDYEQVK